ncbi:MAG: MFS transporter [Candidatus Rokuibacteriota bacterium]
MATLFYGPAMPFPTGLRALNHRDFRRWYLAALVSQVGTWMQSVAQAWLVLQLTNSPLLLGLIGTLQWGPMLFLALVSGAIADRLPKRRLLMATQAAMGGQALILGTLAATGHVRYWHIGLLALVAGVANALDNPARQSFNADLVGRDDVVNAVALNSAAFNSARIVGPAAAGLLIGRWGVVPTFFINGVSFLVVLGALATVRVEGRSRAGTRRSMAEEIREGLDYALRTPRIRQVLAVLLVVSFCVFNFSVYVPLLARTVLGLGAEGFGFLMASVGVGAVAGALTLGIFVSRQPPLAVLFGAAAVACAGLIGIAAVRQFELAVPLLFIVGFAGIVAVAGCNTALQINAPDALRGRVMSIYTLIFGGSFPIASIVIGALSERWGVSTAFLAAGITGLTSLMIVLIARRLTT